MASLRIGFAGTAKNTGKTTTMSATMEEFLRHGWRLGLTSIGYDGEDLDNVTGLPKPRIFAPSGLIVATALRCMDLSSAGLTVKVTTDVYTPLGQVAIAVVSRPGLVVLAGPSHSQGLLRALEGMEAEGAQVTFIDGAFNRISPMNVAHGMVLCTGAARDTRIPVLAEEAESVEYIMGLPVWGEGGLVKLKGGCLMGEEPGVTDVELGDRAGVLVEGVVSPVPLSWFLSKNHERFLGKWVVFQDSLKLMVGGKAAANTKVIREFRELGVGFALQRSLRLLGVSVNPFYPERKGSDGTFEAKYVSASKLMSAFRSRLKAPVVNVVQDGAEAIYRSALQLVGNG
ncbi:MAG: hypothetical protein ACPLPR_04125 [Bacillota bacterium]